jgi:transcriptional regulator with XRE-family HTH domain
VAKVDTYQHPELGQALRFLRARSGLSQARVADQVSARGGRLTAVWLSRIESAADRGGGPYPSVALLDRILTVLGSDRAELERLLRERPWGRVGEGAEWEEAAPAAVGRPAESRAPASPALGVALSSAAASPPPTIPGAPRAAASSAATPPPDVAAEAAELGARYARLPRAAQLELLARVRELS